MPDATVRSHSDAWVAQDAQHKNWGKGNRLWVRGTGSAAARHAFIGFAKPFPHNDALVVVNATLTLRVKDDWGGSHDVTARRVTETWKESRVTWANAPATTDQNAATETVNAASDGDKVEIDVTDILGDIALGDDWFGIRLELDDDVARTFYASDSPHHVWHPQLEVEWGFAPYPPTDLDPAGGQVIGTANPVFSWSFRDIVQENSQAASQVQTSATTDFSSPVYDSGKRSNTVHRWPTAGETTIPDGATRYWRVRTWDEQNRASGWSDTVHFQRVAKGVITFVSPGPSNTVDDLTPLVSWTFTGEQDQVKLKLLEVLPDRTTRERWVYQRHHYTDDSLTIPARKKHPIIKSGHDYRLQLFIWDDEDRVGTSRDPAYAFGQIDFTYVRDGTPDPVDSLTASIPALAPAAVLLTWTRAATPDYFAVVADGEESYYRINPVDVNIAAGQYQMLYREATPEESTTYEIEAVEIIGDHNKHSNGNPTVTATTNPTGAWLVDDDFDEAVRILGTDTPGMTIGESGTTYDLVGNREPVRITDAVRGYEGTFSGMILSDDARNTLLELKGREKNLRLIVGTLNFEIYLEEITISPSAQIPSREPYEVSLTFFQSGDFFEADRSEDY